jgi:DNA-directed RNA polymerase specialized sigma24 family protein
MWVDEREGYQLFRLALVDRDQQAWAALDSRFRAQLLYWVRAHPLYPAIGEAAEVIANQALVQLWRSIGPGAFDDFPNLASLLAYLRRCVHNLVIDQARAQMRERRREQALAVSQLPLSRGTAPLRRVLDNVRTEEIWSVVRSHCRSYYEERLAYEYLVLGLKPREILARDPTTYRSTATITADLSNLLRRLRRSQTLRLEFQAAIGH